MITACTFYTQPFEKLILRSIKLTKDLYKWGKSKSELTINKALRIASAELTQAVKSNGPLQHENFGQVGRKAWEL